ncbi:MAG: aromatic amino acid lyase, partial [Bacillota bacterium]
MSKEIVLTGFDLTIEDFIKIVKERKKVSISEKAKKRIKEARKFVLNNLDTDKPVYGMNRGVGENKDQV